MPTSRNTSAAVLASDQAEHDRDVQPERSLLMFDPWLTSNHRVVTGLADDWTEWYARRPRLRRMKDRDRENLNAILRTILANLAFAALQADPPGLTFASFTAEPPSIGISLRTAKQKLTRYDRQGFTGLPATLAKVPAWPGLFTLHTSHQKGIASKIVIGPDLITGVRALGISQQHFALVEGRETIYLSQTVRDYIDGTVTREPIDYADTPETNRYRAEMAKINAFLAKADLSMEPDGGPLVVTRIRHLRRYFNLPPDSNRERFDLGGRLFGGWWQDLSRERRAAIRINGEPIADLDFASMFLRLAYREAGIAPPDGDLYAAVPGLSDPRWRDGVKKVVSAMLFRSSPLTKVPRDLKDALPPRVSGRSVRSAILAAHPALAPVFETGLGLRLMFTESQILVAALLRLIDHGIPVLPMHDGLMVARSKAGAAMDAMTAASVQIIGTRLPISLKS
jgi:hypothetical protein